MSAVLRAKPSTGPCWPRSSARGWRSSNLRLGIRLRRLPRLIPSLAGCRTSFRRPFLGFYRRDGLGIGATTADHGYFAGRAGIQREDIFVGGGRAGRPQPADVLSQPGGMDELQAFLSLLAASTGTWAVSYTHLRA